MGLGPVNEKGLAARTHRPKRNQLVQISVAAEWSGGGGGANNCLQGGRRYPIRAVIERLQLIETCESGKEFQASKLNESY